MGVLRISLLGGLAITRDDDHPGSPPGATARSLLAYLVAYRSRPHTRDLLAGTFWPDLPDDAARRRLSQALWHIRRSLEPDPNLPSQPFLLTEGDTLQVNPEFPLWTDSEEFTTTYTRGASAPPRALECFEACLKLYRGEFLAGYYDDWVLVERERLRNLYLAALGQLVAGYKSQGQYEQALAHARTLVSQDPWSEEAHREIMRLCHLLDRVAEALKQYETCQQLLKDDLGIEPAPETQALAVEIAGTTSLSAPSWLPVTARPVLAPLLERPDRLPLVGRQTELADLLRLVEGAARGQGGLALVYGEAGVGKTRLLQELARNAQWRGLRVAWGRCYELDGPPAYQPLVEVFRTDLPALNAGVIEPLWHTELARLLPEMATGETPPVLKPEEEQRRLMEAVVRGFQALGHTAPYLIILEDAHWMDQASLAALRYLLPRLAETPLVVVVSARSEDLSPPIAEALAALENTRLPRRLKLGRLNLGETGLLVQHALALQQPPALFSARLYTETEGNPFFITETLRILVDEGLLYRDAEGAWSTPWDQDTDNYAALPLPGSVAQSIQLRLERLPAPLAEALGLAAVIGRGVSFKVWQQASHYSEQELLSISDELCTRGLLLCSDIGAFPAIGGSADYAFSHDQIRRVAFDRLTPPRLRFYHSRVAEALTALKSDSPEALAYHWAAAQVWDKAVDFHQQAGDRAMQVYALADALAHYTQALDGSGRLPGASDLPRQFDLRLAREKIFALQGARQPQTQELAALAELAEALNDDRRRAEVALRRARQAQLTSDFLPAIAAASLAIELAAAAHDLPIQTESHIEWGWALLMQGEHAAALSQFEEALILARQASLRSLEADGLHGLGTVCLVTGDYTAAKAYFQQVLDIASQVDIRPRQGSTLANLGYIATAQGDHTASKDYSQQALRIHRETGDQRGAALVMQNLADEFLAEGDFHTARDYLEQALDIQQVTQAQDNVGGILGALGFLFHRLGDYRRAEQYYTQAKAIFNELGIRWYQGQNLAYLSLLHHHLGDNQAARQYSQQGLEIAQEIGDRLAQGWLLDSLGHALAGLGLNGDARQAYQQALKLRQEQDEAHKAAESLAGLARLALTQGDTIAACQYVEEILRIQNQRGLEGANEPFRIYLTCYHVLQACQDPRAETVLNQAYTELSAQRAKIKDIDLEHSFLENVAAHRELSAAYHAWQSRQQGRHEQVSLPRADAPGGRPLRADEYTPVTWTVSAPGDEQIPGNAARRQQRLLRLLIEAQAQGASPTYEHLAQALEVSTRTIERDILALRQQGVEIPPTRKKLSP